MSVARLPRKVGGSITTSVVSSPPASPASRTPPWSSPRASRPSRRARSRRGSPAG